MKLKELLCNRHFQLGAVIVILGLVPIFVNNASVMHVAVMLLLYVILAYI